MSLTAVVISYNNRALTLQCLTALEAQRREVEFDIIVVDNASTDGSADAIAAAHPNVRLVRAGRNRGFAGGNNLAFRHVTTEWAVLVNNDAMVRPGFMAALSDEVAALGPEVAALTARVILADTFRPAGPDEIGLTGPTGTWVADPGGTQRLVNSTGNQVLTTGYGTDRGWLEREEDHHPERAVFGFCGAAAALRMSAVRELGGFDESFFLYYEDTDLSWRLRLAGYRTGYVERAVVDHHHSASTSEGSELFRFYNERNRLAILVKNASGRRVLRQWGKYILTTGSLALRRRAAWTITKVRLKAFFSALALLPRLLQRRRDYTASDRARVESSLIAPVAG